MSETGKDALLINKIMAGFLTAGIVLWGANRIASVVIHTEPPEKLAIPIAGMQTAAPPPAPAPGLVAITPLLAGADIAKGAAFVQQQCSACHTLNQGGAAGVGPNLYGVVGAAMFSGSFGYSAAVKAKTGTWTPEVLSAWLADPAGFAPGTMMAYPGIKNAQTRADVIAYLNQNSDHPIKLPGAK